MIEDAGTNEELFVARQASRTAGNDSCQVAMLNWRCYFQYHICVFDGVDEGYIVTNAHIGGRQSCE